jgi:putative protein-disulfide isomerase
MAVVHVLWFTDPVDPWSWAAEPSRRRLEQEFGENLATSYVMAGLAREFSGDPAARMAEWLEAGARSGMPVDPRPWAAGGAPRSSYPACMAVKAAQDQGPPEAAAAYLRRLREGLMAGGQKLDHLEAFVDAGRDVPALILERLRIDLGSHAIVEAFGADRDRAKEAGVADGGGPLPRFEAAGSGGTHVLSGLQPYEAYHQAVLAAGGQPADRPRPTVEQALREHGRLAAAEVGALCDLPGPRAEAELWRLASEWRARPEPRMTGTLWRSA